MENKGAAYVESKQFFTGSALPAGVGAPYGELLPISKRSHLNKLSFML
ncbi:MAG: hypothetical protein ACI4V3_00785 [Faecousia sp.]